MNKQDKAYIVESLLHSFLIQEIEAYAQLLNKRNRQIALLLEQQRALEDQLRSLLHLTSMRVRLNGNWVTLQRLDNGDWTEVIDLTGSESESESESDSSTVYDLEM